jgi:signal transduction histidine kinase
LLHLSRFKAGVYRERDGFRRRIYQQCNSATDEPTSELIECSSQTAEWMNAGSFVTAPIRYRNKTLGQMCLTSSRPSAFNVEDAIFLEQIVDQIIPVLENVRLVDRLATDAAEHERSRIGRSIHDRVIQPYLGLQMGLDAVRQSLGAELLKKTATPSLANSLKSVELLERLSVMTKEGVEELREYVYGLQRPDGRRARLVDSIGRYASQFADVTGINVQVVDRIEHVTVHDRLAAEVFQMVTEALSNVRRHTRANGVVIYLESMENTLTIRCENDDSSETLQRHFRPGSIADRAEALGGRAQASSEGGHTTVLMEVPL